jgi:hypothetical protein
MLYRIALGRGFYDALVDRFIIAPVLGLARMLSKLEPQWVKASAISGSSHPAEMPGALTQLVTKSETKA